MLEKKNVLLCYGPIPELMGTFLHMFENAF